MIPKIIHFCWLSNEPIPNHLQKCIYSWNRFLPDYKVMKWDTNRFDINSVPLVQEAFNAKKWAFAADYIRAYALYNYGGIYLDSDVMLYKNLQELLKGDFVTGMEYHTNANPIDVVDSEGNRLGQDIYVPGVGLQAAFMASVSKHPLVKDVLDFYEGKTLSNLLDNKNYAPVVWGYCAEKYGFRFIDTQQKLLSNILIYPTTVISNYDQFTSNSFLVHFCSGSWVEGNSIKKRILSFIKTNRLLFIIYNWLKKL